MNLSAREKKLKIGSPELYDIPKNARKITHKSTLHLFLNRRCKDLSLLFYSLFNFLNKDFSIIMTCKPKLVPLRIENFYHNLLRLIISSRTGLSCLPGTHRDLTTVGTVGAATRFSKSRGSVRLTAARADCGSFPFCSRRHIG